MAHERREARLAAAAVHLLAEHGAVERERDLAGERAHRGALGLGRLGGRGDEQRGGLGAARRERDDVHVRVRGGQAGGERVVHIERDHRLAFDAPSARRRDATAPPAGRTSAGRGPQRAGGIPPVAMRHSATAAPGVASASAASTATRSISSPLGRGDELGAGAAEQALALERAVLLAHEPGHPDDDEPEQHDRRGPDRGVVEVADAEVVDDPDHGRDERRAREQREPEAAERDLAAVRGLVEPGHRRMQAGRAPEQVGADPAGVEPELVVVAARAASAARRRSR